MECTSHSPAWASPQSPAKRPAFPIKIKSTGTALTVPASVTVISFLSVFAAPHIHPDLFHMLMRKQMLLAILIVASTL